MRTYRLHKFNTYESIQDCKKKQTNVPQIRLYTSGMSENRRDNSRTILPSLQNLSKI